MQDRKLHVNASAVHKNFHAQWRYHIKHGLWEKIMEIAEIIEMTNFRPLVLHQFSGQLLYLEISIGSGVDCIVLYMTVH